MCKHKKYIEEALREAIKSKLKQRHGAVLIHRNKIIARGHNKYLRSGNTYKDAEGELRTTHAEADVISQVPREILQNCTLIVVRLPLDRNISFSEIDIADCQNSAPCARCEELIKKSKIPITMFS